jgi:hypothetical protein
MRRILIGSSLTLILIALAGPQMVSGQSVFLGAAATIPTQDFADFGDGDGAKTGFMGFGGVLFPVGTGAVSVGAEGFFGSNSHETEGDKTNLYGALALVALTLGDEFTSIRPSFFGGLGYMTHSYKSETFAEGSESGLAGGAGLAVGFPLGGIGGSIAGSYNFGLGDLDGTTFIAISALVQIPVGGS